MYWHYVAVAAVWRNVPCVTRSLFSLVQDHLQWISGQDVHWRISWTEELDSADLTLDILTIDPLQVIAYVLLWHETLHSAAAADNDDEYDACVVCAWSCSTERMSAEQRAMFTHLRRHSGQLLLHVPRGL